jgi:type I restriction enzyme S subunit
MDTTKTPRHKEDMGKRPASSVSSCLGGSKPLPPGWRWVKLGEVGIFEAGGTPPKQRDDYWNGDIPFVTGADITELDVTSRNARTFLSRDGLYSGKTAICGEGIVLIVTRTRVGRVGIARETMGVSQDITAFKCVAELYPEYLCRYLQNISRYLIENCRGATIQGLTRDFVENLQIPLPPLSEQRRIAAILKEQMAAVERARAAAEAELEAIETLPAALLRRAFSGEC